ncbi:lactonase family protein [Streptomyces sp. NPDC058001]|uniref:lactonase family protein n=1 Tax=Streptomyces sp. NPDC058001 TaxID=3346300 RepID=UPI0036E16209
MILSATGFSFPSDAVHLLVGVGLVTHLHQRRPTAGSGPVPRDPDAVAIHVFRLDPTTGSLTPLQQIPGSGPAWIEVDPSRRFLYACHSLSGTDTPRVGDVVAYAIDPRDGTLTLLNRASLGDSGPAHLAVAPDGRHVVVANYFYGEYVVLPIGKDGRLGPVSGSLRNTGSGPHPRQDASHPHAVTFDPSGRFLGTADLGIDKVEILRLADGGLKRVSEASVPPGTGPRHIAFSHDARTLYVLGELDGNITAFAYDSATGTVGRTLQTVSTAPADHTGGQSGAEIAVHPSGPFLYGSNRGSGTIAAYRITGPAGRLSPLGFATEGVNGPTNFAVDPSGRWLYVNSTQGNSVVQFAVDPRNGELKPTGNATPVPAPGVIAFRTPD